MENEYALYCNDCTHFSDPEIEQTIQYQDITFPYFPSRVNAVVPIGNVSLSSFLKSHQNPKPEILQVFHQIEDASQKGDEKTKSELKQNKLFYFTPTVNLSKRCYDGIESFNPVLVAEYDKVGERRANSLKKLIFNRFHSCICAYLSPSKSGVKFLFRIPVVQTVEEYKEYFCGLAYYLSQIEGFDGININPTQPLFISFDTDMLIRSEEDVKSWTTRGYKLNAFKPFEGDFDPVEGTQEEVKRIKNRIKSFIEKIEDSAHPQILSISTLAGGFVSAGYISFEELEDFIYRAIEDNDYMQKGTKGYQKTASEMMRKGMSSPVYL